MNFLKITFVFLIFVTFTSLHADHSGKSTFKRQEKESCPKEVINFYNLLAPLLPSTSSYTLPTLTSDDEKKYKDAFVVYFDPKSSEDGQKSAVEVIAGRDQTDKATVYFAQEIEKGLSTDKDIKHIQRLARLLAMNGAGHSESKVRKLASSAFIKAYLEGKSDIKTLEKFKPEDLQYAFAQYSPTSKTDKKLLESLAQKYKGGETLPLEVVDTPIQDRSADFKKLDGSKGRTPPASWIAEKIAAMIKNHSVLSCHDNKLHNLYEVTRENFLDNKAQDTPNFLALHANDGKGALEDILKNPDINTLLPFALTHFYSLPGLKATLLASLMALQNNQPMLAASLLDRALKNLDKLLPLIQDKARQSDYGKMRSQLAMLALFAYKSVNDMEGYQKTRELLSKNSEVEFNPKLTIPIQKAVDASLCIKPIDSSELFKSYDTVIQSQNKSQKTSLFWATTNHRDYFQKNLAKHFKPETPLRPIYIFNKDQIEFNACEHSHQLFWFTFDTKLSIPQLAQALGDPDLNIRDTAADTLGKIGKDAKDAVPALVLALKDQNPFVRMKAANALGKIGKDAVPTLILALKDHDNNVRRVAADTLGKIGKDAKDAVPALVLALKDHDPNLRMDAADALGKIGKDAKDTKDVVPALILALKDHDHSVRIEAANALGKIGKDSVPALILALKDHDNNVRRGAANALGKIGKDAKASLDALKKMAKDDEDENTRIMAVLAINSIE